MQATISIIGMVIALGLLAFMVMKGINIFVAAISVSLIVALTGGLDIYEAIKVNYMTGFVGFFRNNFLIFLAGSMMAKVYEITGASKSIARLLLKVFGAKNAVLAMILATGILTYGGIAGFVVCFSLFPIGLEIFRAADIPRRFVPGVIIFGCCTFSAIGPGNPQVSQVVLVNALGTDLMTHATVGFACTILTLVLGVVYFNLHIARAKKKEHFVAKPFDTFNDEQEVPGAFIALLPLILSLIAINVKVGEKAIVPIEYGVFLGSVLAFILMRNFVPKEKTVMEHVTASISNAMMAVSNTSTVVGFGSVVSAAVGFNAVVNAMTSIPGPDLVAVAVATNILAGVCGSGSGGLGLAAPILAPIYAARGMSMGILHRVMLVSSTGLDTMPYNGFVVTVINGVCKETHKDAYIPVFWANMVIPIIVTIVAVILFTLFPNWP
jgi:H+/gluconate symporter and related permeases